MKFSSELFIHRTIPSVSALDTHDLLWHTAPVGVTPASKVKAMILNDDDVLARLDSPLNLMNRLKRIQGGDSPCLPVPTTAEVVEDYTEAVQPPSVDELIDNFENRITQGRIVETSLAVLDETITQLRFRLPEVEKPERLSRIATDVSKVIDSFRTTKKESHGNAPILVWKPVMVNENYYESVVARD